MLTHALCQRVAGVQNYALYRRVDHLIAEGRELKQQLNEMRRQKERVAKLVQGEDEVRHNALTSVDKAIQGVKERLEACVPSGSVFR